VQQNIPPLDSTENSDINSEFGRLDDMRNKIAAP
jgi:hypothetical protein